MKGFVEVIKKRIKLFNITIYDTTIIAEHKDNCKVTIDVIDNAKVYFMGTYVDLPCRDVMDLLKILREEGELQQARKDREKLSLLKKWIKLGDKAFKEESQ